MDFDIVDTINRRDVTKITARLDALDLPAYGGTGIPWYRAPMADTLMSETDGSRPDRAWLVGQLAERTPGIAFDGAPADCDWDNLFAHFRAAILARRDPDSSPARTAETPVRGMV